MAPNCCFYITSRDRISGAVQNWAKKWQNWRRAPAPESDILCLCVCVQHWSVRFHCSDPYGTERTPPYRIHISSIISSWCIFSPNCGTLYGKKTNKKGNRNNGQATEGWRLQINSDFTAKSASAAASHRASSLTLSRLALGSLLLNSFTYLLTPSYKTLERPLNSWDNCLCGYCVSLFAFHLHLTPQSSTWTTQNCTNRSRP